MSSISTINGLYTSMQGSLIIIGIAYLVSIAILKKFNAVTISINIGVVSLFFINNLVAILLIIGAVNVLQGIYLLYKKELKLGLKNLSFGYFFILMAIPGSAGIMAVGLVLLFSVKFLTISFEQEISDPVLYFSNIVAASIAILKFQPDIISVGLLSALLMLLIAFSVLRFLTTSTIDTSLYVMPQLLCAAVLAPPIYVALAVVYVFSISTLNMTKNKAVHLLDLLPYVDSTLFMVIASTLVSKYNYKYSLAIGIILFVLLLLSSMKSFEKYFKDKKHQKWSNIFTALFFASILIVFMPVLLEGRFKLYQPVPVFLSILLIAVEGRYVAFFSKFKVVSVSSVLLKFFEFTYGLLDKAITAIANAGLALKSLIVRAIKAVIVTVVYSLSIVPRLFILYINRRPKSRLHKKIDETVNKGEVYFYKSLKLEDLISIAIILILLMYYLGDF